MLVDDDSDSEEAFEIGIANANKKSQHKYLDDEDSLDSLPKPSNRMMPEEAQDFIMNDFVNANRRRIQTANKQDGFSAPHPRPMLGAHSTNQASLNMHLEKSHPVKQIRTANKPKSATGYRINQSKKRFRYNEFQSL